MRPTFTLSLDKELIWGSFDHTSDREFARWYPDLRGTVDRLLALLDEYEIASTWAIVGHLFLSECSRGSDGRPHPELVRPNFRWYRGDWFDRDPCSNRGLAPLWYGDDVVDAVLATRVRHEIASHSFSHLVFGDPGCSPDAARSDLSACVAVARERGLTLRSFVFPRNVEGHHALLREHGFSAYRGEDPTWYRAAPNSAKRALHFIDQAAGSEPPVSVPTETLPGLWNIPGSMLLMHRSGIRRFISPATSIHRARLGLRRAARERAVFHLWFHPFNLAHESAAMFAALRGILAEVRAMRDRGAIDVATMADIASSLSTTKDKSS